MKLDLVDGWWNSSIAKHIPNQLHIEIGNTDALDQTLIYQSFHLGPNLVHWNFDSFKLSVSYVLDCDWPMHQVQI